MNRKLELLGIAGLVGLAFVFYSIQDMGKLATVESKALSADTGTLSGQVDAPKSFKAAKVYARNVDKNILYMVYTSGGRYRAIKMLPGKYEVTVRKSGFATDPKTVVLKAGGNATLDFTLREGRMEFGSPSYGAEKPDEGIQLVAYDTLYPPGRGRELLEGTCLVCHGPNYIPAYQLGADEWSAVIDLMQNPENEVGAMIPPGKFSPKDRERLVAYLAKNFGPDSPNRALKIDAEMPLDEGVLSKAMYVEYYLPLDPQLDAKNKQRRGQDPHLDNDGNVWYTDRSIPNRVGRLDPRTGEIKDFVLPDPKADAHGLTVDAWGKVWWAETFGFHLGLLDPKTGEMTRFSMDPEGTHKGGHGHTPVMDSKQNVWFTAIRGNAIGKWDRQTQKVTLYSPPTPNTAPYGILVDRNDKIWIAEFRAGKIANFDPVTEKWKEYPALTQPCTIRRLGMDSQGTIWYGVFSGGKLGKLNPKTEKIVEYTIPMPFSQPYDTWPDAQDNIWVSDGGQGGALIKFDPRREKFTYYPTPQRTDQPKLEIARDGGIWYCPRSAVKAAVGVLYPDVTKVTTLAAPD